MFLLLFAIFIRVFDFASRGWRRLALQSTVWYGGGGWWIGPMMGGGFGAADSAEAGVAEVAVSGVSAEDHSVAEARAGAGEVLDMARSVRT